MSRTLWIPACPECQRPHHDLVYLPGAEDGPLDPSRIYAHWNCLGCAKRIYLPRSVWVRAGSLDGP